MSEEEPRRERARHDNRARPPSALRRATGLLQRSVSLKLIFVLALVIILSPVAASLYKTARNLVAWSRVEQATLSVLRSENLTFLVTDRLVSQVVVEVSENSPLLGKREGVLIGTVRMYYGLDLSGLDKSCLSREGTKLIVRLPDPKELDFSIDPGSLKYITKRSGLNVIADFIMNRDIEAELRSQFQVHATKFFKDNGLLPTREKIVRRLQEFMSPVAQELGVSIELR